MCVFVRSFVCVRLCPHATVIQCDPIPNQVFKVCVFVSSGVPCAEGDYKRWSPSDERGNDCLLGSEMVYKRRTPHATCFNGEDFDRPVTVSNCSCTRQDYEW